jgi:hypothetical protein
MRLHIKINEKHNFKVFLCVLFHISSSVSQQVRTVSISVVSLKAALALEKHLAFHCIVFIAFSILYHFILESFTFFSRRKRHCIGKTLEIKKVFSSVLVGTEALYHWPIPRVLNILLKNKNKPSRIIYSCRIKPTEKCLFYSAH